jgi:hypothetical protein
MEIQTPPVPPPPPFAISTELDPSCEEDVDLDDDDEYCPIFGDDDDQGDEEQQLAQDTQREEVEPLGEASSLEEFFRSQLEDLIDPCLHTWLFDALDFDEVQRQFEGNRYRYILEGKCVYRAGL